MNENKKNENAIPEVKDEELDDEILDDVAGGKTQAGGRAMRIMEEELRDE